MAKKTDQTEIPAVVKILARLESCHTDPVQYKPYSPHFQISNEFQEVFVELKLPGTMAEVKTIGKGAKQKRQIFTTAEGMAVMLKILAAEMMAAQVTN